MSAVTTIRNAIDTVLKSVEGVGQVHVYERYAIRLEDIAKLFKTGDKILGWTIHRRARIETEGDSNHRLVAHVWDIRAYMSFVDAAESGVLFDELIDTVILAFRKNETLGGLLHQLGQDGRVGPQLEESVPAMFCGLLCHSARLSLTTVVEEDVREAATDDFGAMRTQWDMADLTIVGVPGPDGQIDAEDTVDIPIQEDS
jgi:hypothetical protein